MNTKFNKQLSVILFISTLCCINCATTNLEYQQKKADHYALQGNFAAALKLYGQYLCKKPNNFVVATAYVQTWHQLGAAQKDDTLSACLAETQTELYIKALKYAAKQEYAKALSQLEKIKKTTTPENHAEFFYRQGLIAMQVQNANLAYKSLVQAHQKKPKRIDILLALSQSLLDVNNISTAQKHLHSLFDLKPTSSDLKVAMQIQDSLVKLSYAQLPIDVDKDIRAALRKIESQQLNREVIHHILALSRTFPHPRVQLSAGLASLRYGLQKQGEDLLKEAIKNNAFDPNPCQALAFYYAENKQPTEALHYYEKAFARNPYDSKLALVLAKHAEEIGKLDLALRALHTLQLLEPLHNVHILSLARVYRKQDNFIYAQQHIDRAHQMAPDNLPIVIEWLTIALDAAQSSTLEPKERKQAQKNAHKALKKLEDISPNHPAKQIFHKKLQSIEQAT